MYMIGVSDKSRVLADCFVTTRMSDFEAFLDFSFEYVFLLYLKFGTTRILYFLYCYRQILTKFCEYLRSSR